MASGVGAVCDSCDTLRKFVVHVDSRDRDFDAHPSPNSYKIRLPARYTHVMAARLLGCELPSSFFVFTAALGNTSMKVTSIGDGGARDTQTVTIPDGNYTQTTIVAFLQGALNDAFPAETLQFQVALNPVSLNLTIATTGNEFEIDAAEGSTGVGEGPVEWGLGYYLGIPKGAVLTSSGKMLTLPGVVSLNPFTYLLLDIAELNNVDTGGLYGSEVGPRTFAKVPLSNASFEYVFTGKDATYQMHLAHVQYRPPVQRLDRLSIAFKFHNGQVVDFNGIEHSFSIELTCRLPHVAGRRDPARAVRPPPRQPTPVNMPNVYIQAPPSPPPQKKKQGWTWWWIAGFIAAIAIAAVYAKGAV